MLGQAFSTVPNLLRHYTGGSAHPSSSPQFCTPSSSVGIHYINPAPLSRLPVWAHTRPGPPPEFSADCSDMPADHSPDVSAVASCAVLALDDAASLPEHAPSTVGDTIKIDDASSTTNATVHCGTTASPAFGCIALLHTGFSQTFILRNVLKQTLSAIAVTNISRTGLFFSFLGGDWANLLPCQSRGASA